MLLQLPVACIYLAIPLETEYNKLTLTDPSELGSDMDRKAKMSKGVEGESCSLTARERQMTTGGRRIVWILFELAHI